MAIRIPIFTSQLEKARQPTDAANLSAAYAEAVMDSLHKDGSVGVSKTPMKITRNGKFDKIGADAKIGTIVLDNEYASTELVKGTSYDVNVAVDGTTTITVHS